MSRIVTTTLGRFRSVTDGATQYWLWECPGCKTWGRLGTDQMEGRVSVYCTTPVLPGAPGYEPGERFPCGYHQTHEYAKELALTISAKQTIGLDPFEEDAQPAKGE